MGRKIARKHGNFVRRPAELESSRRSYRTRMTPKIRGTSDGCASYAPREQNAAHDDATSPSTQR
jgi:hypothetical protein